MKNTEGNKPSMAVRYWLNEINDAKKRDKEYRKEGQRIVDIYAGKKQKQIPFNILYSNTETLLPALYSSTPKPVVQRRFKDPDPVGKAASVAGQRCLEYLIDTNVEDYETFDAAMRDATLDGLLPGRGCTRIKYEAEITEVPQAGGSDGEEAETIPTKTWETVCTETVSWDRIYFGYAKRWAKMPWIAFEHYLDREEATRLFGSAMASKLIYTKGEDKNRDDEWDGPRRAEDGEDNGERKTCLVYEIWKKKKKVVCFLSPRWQGDYLKEEEDPLELSGFYPIPKPMQFIVKTNDLNPTALYALYENQATELNKISTRINRIVEAIKVRGTYDGSLGDTLGDLLKGDDNSMIPTSNASNIAVEGGLDKYIWFMPLDKLIAVLRELIVSREQCKQVIYEITGIADILRGTTDANETLGAQQIKNQWASMRIKMMQNEVRRYVREALRMMLEVSAKKFSPETFAQMTGLPYTTEAEKMQAQALIQASVMSGQQPDPQAVKTMETPSWEEVLSLLQNDIERSYRIDIETNSTIEVNEMEDKQNITEAMAAMGQFITGVTPLVQEGVMPFEAAQSMLLAIVRRFRFGTEVEEQIKTMKPPQPKQDPAAEAEKAKMQADMAIGQQEAKFKGEQMQMQAQYSAQEHAFKMQELQAKSDYEKLMAKIRMMEAEAKLLETEAKIALLKQQAAMPKKEKEAA